MNPPSLSAERAMFRFPRRLLSKHEGFFVGPVDLQLGPGIHHLRGRNGAGKSTLLRALAGGLRLSEGVARVCGQDLSVPSARANVALLPGRPSLPGFLSIDEAWQLLAGLRGAPTWDGRPAREALGLPGGLKLSAASDGQARKAELVAALAGDPPVLLLDEPTDNLDLLLDEPLALMDAATVELLKVWVESWRADRVVLATSHEALPFDVDSQAELLPGQPLSWRA